MGSGGDRLCQTRLIPRSPDGDNKFLTDSSAPPLTGQLVGVLPMDPMATTSVADLSKILLLSSSPTWCFFYQLAPPVS